MLYQCNQIVSDRELEVEYNITDDGKATVLQIALYEKRRDLVARTTMVPRVLWKRIAHLVRKNERLNGRWISAVHLPPGNATSVIQCEGTGPVQIDPPRERVAAEVWTLPKCLLAVLGFTVEVHDAGEVQRGAVNEPDVLASLAFADGLAPVVRIHARVLPPMELEELLSLPLEEDHAPAPKKHVEECRKADRCLLSR